MNSLAPKSGTSNENHQRNVHKVTLTSQGFFFGFASLDIARRVEGEAIGFLGIAFPFALLMTGAEEEPVVLRMR